MWENKCFSMCEIWGSFFLHFHDSPLYLFIHCSFRLHRNSVVPCTWVAATSALWHCHRYVELWLCPSRTPHWVSHLHRQKWAWSAVLYNTGKRQWKPAFRNMNIHLMSGFILIVFYCLGAWNAFYWCNRKIWILDCVLWWAQNTQTWCDFPVVFILRHLCWTGIVYFVLLKLASGKTRL